KRAAGGPAFGLQGMAVVYETVRQLSGYNDILTFVFLILFGIGTYVIWRERMGKAALLIALLIVPLIASVILSGIIPMVPRYLIYLLPILFTGIGAAYNPFARALETGKITYVFIIILVLAQVPYLSGYYTTYSKDDWRGFAQEVVQVTSPGDVVVLVPGYLDQPFDYYYSNTSDGTLEYGASERASLERIAAMFSDRKMFIVLTPDIGAADQSGQTWQWLTDNTTVLSRWEKAIFLLQRK
ncbi:MAG: glycosyl transferase, partial [Methanomicrobiales archaeon]|nr:glycosyl transferase [Methanomicrobiales archaeon]